MREREIWEPVKTGPFENTRCERLLQQALRKLGIPLRAHPLYYDGQPDIEIAKFGIPILIFVDGDEVHGHHITKTDPPERIKFARRGRAYDYRVTQRLRVQGCVVLRFWESEILTNPEACARTVETAIAARRRQRPTSKRREAL